MRTGDLSQRYNGLYLAEVVDVNDPEKLGRVRVKADQFEDTGDQPTWATVARPSAGDKTGVFFTPKTGDQVIVGYMAGDVREPIILGYGHSTARKPDGDKVDTEKHGIVTTIGSITFDEKGGTILISFKGPPESTVTINKEGVVIASKAAPPEGKITLDAKGITIEALAVTVKTPAFNVQAGGVGITSPSTTVNGQGLVLGSFLDQFAKHVHPKDPPPPFVPVTTTPFDPTGKPLPDGLLTSKGTP